MKTLLILILSLSLTLTGCVTARIGDANYASLLKDISVKGHAKLKDGTDVEIDLTSNVNAQSLQAVAEGVATGVARGIKP